MTSPVNLLQYLSAHQRELIEDAHKEGLSPEQISIRFSLDCDDVRYFIDNFLAPPRSHFERLQTIVDDLEDQCSKMKVTLDQGDPSAMMLQSYQRLMAEYRLALAELMALQKPQDVVDEIIDKSFNPFLISITRSCTEEMKNLQDEMTRLNIPLRDAKGISTDIFKRLLERVVGLLPETKAALDSHFGVKKQEREARSAESKEKTLQ